jgi:hypothetical protein
LLTFGLDRKVQIRDSFFHNANSMIPRAIWDQFPFDEQITNIEDRLWGKQVIQAGFRIIYEPDAVVYHHHGIHQNNRPDRVQNVVRIIEDHIPEIYPAALTDPFDPEWLEVAALVPLRATDQSIDFSEVLVRRTIAAAKASRYINRILVSTESEDLAAMARRCGAEVPFLRPPELAAPGVRVDNVLQQFLEQLEASGYLPDIVVALEVSYPFRPDGVIDGVIEHLVRVGGDSVIAGLSEYRPCWRNTDNGYGLISDTSDSRDHRDPIHVGLPSLVCAAHPSTIRQGSRLAGEVGIYEIQDPLAGIEVRHPSDLAALSGRISI